MVERKVRVVKRHRKIRFGISFRNFSQRFTMREVRDILIAWLILSLTFAYAIYVDTGAKLSAFILILTASFIAIACGFIMHELMHKFKAQEYGYDAAFRLWPFGILLAVITSLFGFVFAAPGATYFEPDPREPILDPQGFVKRYGDISLAGPKINLIFGGIFLVLFLIALIFMPVSVITYTLLSITGIAGYINFFLAAFNLLPILPLDGAKVFNWDKEKWAIYFGVSVLMTALVIIGIIPMLSFVP